VKLFAKGKVEKGAQQPAAPAFSPIDRYGLLGLLDQVVNGSQTGVLELHEPRGNWVYAFQGGALIHASGGRVRGARQAFDLLWEFQSGECMFAPGANASLAGNLYIDKARLLDLLRRSQAVLQGPSAPYIPPDQQRPIAPVTWQPPAAAPAWGAPGYPQPAQGYPQPQPAQGYPQPQPPYPPQQPGYPARQPQPPQAYPQPQQAGYPPQQPPPGYPPAAYPAAPYPGAQPPGQPYPQPAYPQAPGGVMPPAGQPQPAYPAYPQPQAMPQQAMPPQAMPPQPMPAPPPPPARAVTPPSFSVPPMAIPRKREAPLPAYQPPSAAPVPPLAEPPKPAGPKDDLAALRASLVAQAPPVAQAPSAAAWGVRGGEAHAAPVVPIRKGGKGKDKRAKPTAVQGKAAAPKADSKLKAAIKIQLIKFLLWACERRYSPDDHWTLKDAFEISTMELRDQFIGAFSESLKSAKKPRQDDFDDADDMAAGRMRGRGRRH
jgi:hypothetical protein